MRQFIYARETMVAMADSREEHTRCAYHRQPRIRRNRSGVATLKRLTGNSVTGRGTITWLVLFAWLQLKPRSFTWH